MTSVCSGRAEHPRKTRERIAAEISAATPARPPVKTRRRSRLSMRFSACQPRAGNSGRSRAIRRNNGSSTSGLQFPPTPCERRAEPPATSPPAASGTDDCRRSQRLRRAGRADRLETGTNPSPGGPRRGHVNRRSLELPVEWTENAPHRPGFAAEYVSIGSLPGLLHRHLAKANRLRKVLCQTLVLSNSGRSLEGTADAPVDEQPADQSPPARADPPRDARGRGRGAQGRWLDWPSRRTRRGLARGRLEQREAERRAHCQSGRDPGSSAQEARIHARFRLSTARPARPTRSSIATPRRCS